MDIDDDLGPTGGPSKHGGGMEETVEYLPACARTASVRIKIEMMASGIFLRTKIIISSHGRSPVSGRSTALMVGGRKRFAPSLKSFCGRPGRPQAPPPRPEVGARRPPISGPDDGKNGRTDENADDTVVVVLVQRDQRRILFQATDNRPCSTTQSVSLGRRETRTTLQRSVTTNYQVPIG